MLDMGFLPDIRRVLQHLPKARADPLLLGHPAAADRGAGARDAAQPGAAQRRAQGGAGDRRHPGRLPGAGGPEALPAHRAAAARRDQERARLHPHQAPGQPPGRVPGAARRRLRPHPRQPQPGPAHRRPLPLQERHPAGAGGDRHRGPRHRRRGPLPRHQLRRAQHARGLHPPRRPHRPRGDGGRRLHLRLRGGDGRAAGHRARPWASACRASPSNGFDYRSEPAERFEIPIQERIAAIRARKSEERARARAKAERKAQREAEDKARADEKARRQGDRSARPAQAPRGHRPAEAPSHQPRGHRPGESPSHHGRQQHQQPRQRAKDQSWRPPAEPQPREVDPTTKPAEERLSQIRSAFSPARFNRFR